MTNSISFEITSEQKFTDFTELNYDFSNSATDGPVLEGFQVDFIVEVAFNGDKKTFHVVYQNTERNNGLMAYNGYEMSTADQYGCDTDESQELTRFVDYDETILEVLETRANELAKEELNAMV